MNTFIASVKKMHSAAIRSFNRQKTRRQFLDKYYQDLVSERTEQKLQSGKIDKELDVLIRLKSDTQLKNETVHSYISLRNMVFEFKR